MKNNYEFIGTEKDPEVKFCSMLFCHDFYRLSDVFPCKILDLIVV